MKYLCLSLLLFLVSCAGAGSSNTKRLLSASGFEPRKPQSPEQTALYDQMDPYRLYSREVEGKLIYGYKDPEEGVVYVGGSPEHEKYQSYAIQQQIARDQRMAAELEMEAAYGWGSYGWGAWRPYGRRIYY